MIEKIQEELLLIRNSIKKLKNSKFEEENQVENNFNSSYEVILNCIINFDVLAINSTSKIPPALAHEVLGELLKLEIILFERSSSYSISLNQLESFIKIANSLQWNSPYIPVAIPRNIIASLLKLSQSLNLPLSSYFKQQLLESSFFSKRSQAVLSAFIAVLPLSEFAELVLEKPGQTEEGECWIGKGILRRLLIAMDRDDVSQGVGKLVTKWLTKLDEVGLKDMWLEPVLESLAGGDTRRRSNLGNYILPTLLVKGRVDRLKMLLEGGDYIVEGRIRKVEEAMTLIEVAHKAGLISFDDSKDTNPKQFLLPLSFLSISLQHLLPSIQISAFTLLVTSKSTIVLPNSAFPLLRQFFTYTLGEEDSSETTRLLSILLTRLRDSSNAALDDQYTKAVQEFLKWLVNHLIVNISPSKPSRLQQPSIKLLSVILESGVDSRYKCKNSKTTSWLFLEKLDIVNSSTTNSLLKLLVSTYGALREQSIGILDRFPTPLPGYEVEAGISLFKQEILAPALQMIRSGREAEASAGAEIIGFVWRKSGKEGRPEWSLGATGNWLSSDFSGPSELSFIHELLDLADIQLDAHFQNFGKASSQTPMHGTFLTLRHLFTLIPKSMISTEANKAIYYKLSLRALAIVDRVWQVTSVVLAADPMGQLGGVDTEEARALTSAGFQTNEGEVEEGESTMGGPRHKIILSASWRAFKQAAEMLETIFLWPSNISDFWSISEIESVGNSFALWLKVIRHRGGYMAAYACYININLALASTSLSYLPSRWLQSQLDQMAQSDAVSITRKSAGFRLCTLAGLTAVLQNDSTAFTSSFDSLFEIAESSRYSDESRVHTMNTLEAVFLDTKTGGSATLSFLERGFLLCMSTFNSSNWILRNAALMLFGSLLTCAFGKRQLNQPRVNSSLVARSSLSDFFGRFPSLYSALIAHLQSFDLSKSSSETEFPETNPTGFYSVLLLLSLLRTPDGISDFSLELSTKFISLVQKCGKSHLWKIRLAAAESLTGLVQPSSVVEYCTELLEFPKELGENELHGRFVQVLRLLQYSGPLSADDSSRLNDALSKNLAHVFQSNRSFAIRTTFLQIAAVVVNNSKFKESSHQLIPIIIEQLETTRRWSTRISHLPNAQELAAEAFSFVLLLQPSSTLYKAGLVSPHLSVKRHALSTLVNAEKTIRQSCWEILFNLISSEPSIQVQAVRVAMEIDLPETECAKVSKALTQQYTETLCLPLRDALTPLIARIRNKLNELGDLDSYLTGLFVAAQSYQSFELREAAILALSEFSSRLILDNVIFCRAILTLLQDDTHSIRTIACQLVSRYWNDGLEVCELRGCEILMGIVGTPSLTEQLDEMNIDLILLNTTKSQLFNVEKANIFIDDTAGADFSINHQRVQTLEDDNPILQEALLSWQHLFDTCYHMESHSAPLGLASNPIISKWARRIVANQPHTSLGVKCLDL